MNKALFGIIGVLMLAIAGVSFMILFPHQQIAAPAPVTTPAPAQATSSQPSSSSQPPGTYTLAQVTVHNSASSCYTAINGSVYDVTSWINQHPGGPEAILSLCGKDGSAAFNNQHGGQARPADELATFKIGTLAQ